MKTIILAYFVLLANSVFAQQKTESSYKTYYNYLFGYSIKYPDKLLTPEPEAGNGDGRWFKDKNGNRNLEVYGEQNWDHSLDTITSFKQVYKSILEQYKAHANSKITYSKLGKSYFVICGTIDNKIFYQKTIKRGAEGYYVHAILEYPYSQRAVYNAVSEVIFKSFK